MEGETEDLHVEVNGVAGQIALRPAPVANTAKECIRRVRRFAAIVTVGSWASIALIASVVPTRTVNR